MPELFGLRLTRHELAQHIGDGSQVAGRHTAREDGTLQFIEAQTTRQFDLDFEVLPDNAAIERVGGDLSAGARR